MKQGTPYATGLAVAASLAASLTLAACGGKNQAPPPPPPPEVGIITAEAAPVAMMSELPGRTSAYLVAQVRARVDGIVQSRDFTEGAIVKQGQRLYKIDPAPYIAALNTAKATLARAEANLASTSAQAERYKALVAANAISKQDYDNAVSAEGQARADVAAGKAAVDTAQINLGYTDVVSHISGQIGISQVTPGAYVQASAATLLSTVQQIDSIYVNLTQSSLEGLKLRRDLQEGRLKASGPDAAKVTLILEDGQIYKEKGKLQFSDVTVDQSTGSVTIRALFPNPDRVLLPGMFVRARIEQGVNDRAILIPQVGVIHNQKGQSTVLVVGKDDKVEVHPIVTAGVRGQDWIVESGIQPGDRVIVQGVEKVKPEMQVKTVPAQLPPPPPPGAPSVDMATGATRAAAKAASDAGAASGVERASTAR